MTEDPLVRELERGTRLVTALIEGKMTLDAFERDYGDFYYYNALRGDEGIEDNNAVIARFRVVCEMHGQIQDVLYLLYRGDDVDSPGVRGAGRIGASAVQRRIGEIAQQFGAGELLRLVSAELSIENDDGRE